ncbi:glutamate synthase, partial [Mycobacterium tuberculosis]|nr:glutamate synthase [Mycobacterium tuberculosis]
LKNYREFVVPLGEKGLRDQAARCMDCGIPYCHGTGSDCRGTSNRHGAKSVTQLEIMPQPPERENKALTWPNWPLKMRTSSSHQE